MPITIRGFICTTGIDASAAWGARLTESSESVGRFTRVVQRLLNRTPRVATQAGPVALLVCLACAATGCGSTKPTTHRISIQGFHYLPDSLTVRVGDTVRWTNADLVPHTATAQSNDLDSRSIESRKDWRFVAARAGTYRYACAFHPDMRGTLVVR